MSSIKPQVQSSPARYGAVSSDLLSFSASLLLSGRERQRGRNVRCNVQQRWIGLYLGKNHRGREKLNTKLLLNGFNMRNGCPTDWLSL